MKFSDLLSKMLNGETLSPLEKQDMVLQARRLEDAEALLSGLVVAGTKNLNIEGLQATSVNIDNKTVSIDDDGIKIRAEGALLDANSYKFVDADDEVLGGTYGFFSDGSDLNVVQVLASGAQAQRAFVYLILSSVGGTYAKTMLSADDSAGTDNAEIELIQDGTGRVQWNAIDWWDWEETSAAIPNAVAGRPQFYVKGGKFVIHYNDAGTQRFKYLDLTGTGVTWQHSTSAP